MGEKWFHGYQQGYEDGYDDGYEEGFKSGLEKGRNEGEQKIGFMKVKCVCDFLIPYPVFKKGTTFKIHFPNEEDRRCPNCHLRIPKMKIIRAYSEFKRRQ